MIYNDNMLTVVMWIVGDGGCGREGGECYQETPNLFLKENIYKGKNYVIDRL